MDRMSAISDAFDRQDPRDIAHHTKQLFQLQLATGDRLTCRLHPLGFLMTTLGGTPNGGTLRLHIWNPEFRFRQEPYWPIHDHIFSYRSCVLVGCLRHVEYETLISHEGDRTVYSVGYVGQLSELRRTEDRVQIIGKSTTEHTAGTLYSMDLGIFHETVVADPLMTVTAMLATSPARTAPRVLGDLSGDPFYSYTRREVELPLTTVLASLA